MNKLNKLASSITAVLTLSVISALGIMTFTGKKAARSFTENRKLAELPKITAAGLYDGSAAKQLGEYTADQFAGRSSWIYARTRIQAELTEGLVNGVYVSGSRLLDTEISGKNDSVFAENAGYINDFAASYDGTVYFAAIPSSTGVYGDSLPSHLIKRSDSQQINDLYERLGNDIRKIDAYNILKMLKDNYIYYRNDTKWTSYGAYCVYKTVIQKLGFLPTPYDKYTIEHVSDSFRGNLYNRSLSDKPKADILDIYRYHDGAEILSFEKLYNDGTISEGEMFDRSRLDTSYMYSMYLGEDAPVIKIKTSVQNEKRLLVIKDSYGDCFIPFLVQHYSEIAVVSPRELGGRLSDIIDVDPYGQALFLFGIESLDEKMSIEMITERN